MVLHKLIDMYWLMVSGTCILGIRATRVLFSSSKNFLKVKIKVNKFWIEGKELWMNFWQKKGCIPSGPGAFRGLKDLMEWMISTVEGGCVSKEPSTSLIHIWWDNRASLKEEGLEEVTKMLVKCERYFSTNPITWGSPKIKSYIVSTPLQCRSMEQKCLDISMLKPVDSWFEGPILPL